MVDSLFGLPVVFRALIMPSLLGLRNSWGFKSLESRWLIAKRWNFTLESLLEVVDDSYAWAASGSATSASQVGRFQSASSAGFIMACLDWKPPRWAAAWSDRRQAFVLAWCPKYFRFGSIGCSWAFESTSKVRCYDLLNWTIWRPPARVY